jgi:5-methylcytosine-specific restriction protein A
VILPTATHRQTYLSLLVDSIVEANVYSRDNWAVTCEGRVVRLHVGHYIVFTLEKDQVWLALDLELLHSEVRRGPTLSDLESWGWTPYTDFLEYSDLRGNKITTNGYYVASAAHETVWPEIRRLHFESLYKTHHVRRIDSRTPPKHAPGVLMYLRHQLQRWIPDPLYGTSN